MRLKITQGHGVFRRDQIKDLLTFNSFCLTAIISRTSQFIPYLDVFKVPLRVTLGISPLNLRLVPRKHSDAASYPVICFRLPGRISIIQLLAVLTVCRHFIPRYCSQGADTSSHRAGGARRRRWWSLVD